MMPELKQYIDTLPKTAGVYLFFAPRSLGEVGLRRKEELVYIGKAINIKDRVKNHFMQPSYRDNLFINKVSRIDFINTNSEIEALVLEANLIKKHLPKFNVVWKDDKNYFYVAITKEEHPVVFITHQKNSTRTNYIGPFIEGTPLKKTLKYLRRVFPFYTSTRHPKSACTWCHLDLCPGPNPDMKKYRSDLKKLTLILQGHRPRVLSDLKKEMEAFSKTGKFEEAGKVRDKMLALERILEHTHVIENPRVATGNWPTTQKVLQEMLGMKNAISKIECYDISNIQGKNAVGSMVVFVDGAPDRSQYKKFKIQMKNEPNDIAMLKEVLTRRLAHPEWGYPEVMLIDGGIAQLNVAIRAKGTQKIKIISIAKGKQELLIEDKAKLSLKELPKEIYNLVKHLDDEAHRFAITYHKKLRKKTLLDI
jgi:excinuclease ABC subunit C